MVTEEQLKQRLEMLQMAERNAEMTHRKAESSFHMIRGQRAECDAILNSMVKARLEVEKAKQAKELEKKRASKKVTGAGGTADKATGLGVAKT